MTAVAVRPATTDRDLALFRQTVRAFVAEQFAPHQPRWREQHGPDADAWTSAGAAGLLLSDIPEEFGGGGGTFAHEAVVIEELTRAGVHFGSFVHSSVAHYILAYGTQQQKERWLPRMASGELVGAVAMSEPAAGSDLQGIRTTAQRVGSDYLLNGSKTFVTNGARTGLVCVAVKTDNKAPAARSISLILVETEDLAGYRVGRPLEKIGMHAQDTCELFFADVSVPAANLLGATEGKGLAQLMEGMNYERLAIGVAALATAERAIAVTTEYVKERTAFGKPLFDFQNTRFKLAECRTETEIGRAFLDKCIERFTAGTLDDTTIAMAKCWLTDSECRIVDECLQLHGGYGYMTEYPIARMWTDSRVHRIYGGANEVLKEVIAWAQ
ncbi:MAG TPA: acyl-CoA dehydrogenase family protein [Gemmatimonadaceae bacterium]|jgi:acyl-CoA dehydrogenase